MSGYRYSVKEHWLYGGSLIGKRESSHATGSSVPDTAIKEWCVCSRVVHVRFRSCHLTNYYAWQVQRFKLLTKSTAACNHFSWCCTWLHNLTSKVHTLLFTPLIPVVSSGAILLILQEPRYIAPPCPGYSEKDTYHVPARLSSLCLASIFSGPLPRFVDDP